MDSHDSSMLQQQHPYTANGNDLPPDGTAAGPKPGGDVKPRLTKDLHDILEQHFQQQHKPTTGVKKAFADRLGVPLDKINVSLGPPTVQTNWLTVCRIGFRIAEQR